MDPRLLLIETSGRSGFTATAEGTKLRALRRLDEMRRHARDLAPAVAEVLAEAGWKPRELHGVVVSRGPGSYTGLRVGIVSAKTLAYATGCALIAVDTFAVIAVQAPLDAAKLDVLADAQQEKIYLQRFARGPEGMLPIEPLTIRPFADWLSAREPAAWAAGPGLARFRAQVPADVPVVSEESCNPQPESLLRLGLDRFQAGAREDLHTLEPLYLRPSSAEEKWREKGK